MSSICKVILVGETGVGKTCIIMRFLNNVYEENHISTTGANFASKTLEFKEYKTSLQYDIWDTAGKEIYRSLAKNFYLNAAIGVLVYDIRRRQSFESIKNYWYDQLKESGEENMIIAIVGNKSDLFHDEEVNEEEARKYANSIGAIFMLTSCKENIGINELFEECGKKYLEANNFINKSNKGKNNLKLKKNERSENNSGNDKKNKCC